MYSRKRTESDDAVINIVTSVSEREKYPSSNREPIIISQCLDNKSSAVTAQKNSNSTDCKEESHHSLELRPPTCHLHCGCRNGGIIAQQQTERMDGFTMSGD